MTCALVVGSLPFVLYSSGQAATSRALSRLQIQLFFQSKKFYKGGQRVVAQEIINVRETTER